MRVSDLPTNPIQHSNYSDKICIIIPIRNREAQLEEIVPRLEEILTFQGLDYRIYIVEQADNGMFNLGKLTNVGFIESQRDGFSDYYVKTDVDIFPLTNDLIEYTPYSGVRHLYGHRHSLGGIFSFDRVSFIKTNGHSNEYFGWGWEDVDFLERLSICNIVIDKSNFVERRTNQFIHDAITKEHENTKNETYSINRKLLNLKINSYKESIEGMLNDGLNSCKYDIIERYNYKNNRKIIRIEVDVG